MGRTAADVRAGAGGAVRGHRGRGRGRRRWSAAGARSRLRSRARSRCGSSTVCPAASVVAVDADPVLLALGRNAAGGATAGCQLGGRRSAFVVLGCGPPPAGLYDAAVSTTALHWLPASRLHSFYASVAAVLRPGGVFVDGDHFGFSEAGLSGLAKGLHSALAGADVPCLLPSRGRMVGCAARLSLLLLPRLPSGIDVGMSTLCRTSPTSGRRTCLRCVGAGFVRSEPCGRGVLIACSSGCDRCALSRSVRVFRGLRPSTPGMGRCPCTPGMGRSPLQPRAAAPVHPGLDRIAGPRVPAGKAVAVARPGRTPCGRNAWRPGQVRGDAGRNGTASRGVSGRDSESSLTLRSIIRFDRPVWVRYPSLFVPGETRAVPRAQHCGHHPDRPPWISPRVNLGRATRPTAGVGGAGP